MQIFLQIWFIASLVSATAYGLHRWVDWSLDRDIRKRCQADRDTRNEENLTNALTALIAIMDRLDAMTDLLEKRKR